MGFVANSYIISLKSQEVADKHMNWINRQVANTNTSWVGSVYNVTAAQGTYSSMPFLLV